MPLMEIYVHPTCTSCKKAEALLADSGVPVKRRDYFRDRFEKDELRAILVRAGVTPGEVLSKRARAYKELALEGKDLDDDTLLDLMVEHPTLLKRPLLIGTGGSTVGFNANKIHSLVESER
jgi:Spx/MgsR family transcriptional regulator